MMTLLSKKISNPIQNVQATEVWMIGILLVLMATLACEDDLYAWQAYQVDMIALERYLEEIKNRYSVDFYTLVKRCLDLDPENRPKISDLFVVLEHVKGGFGAGQ